jgi:hypothetical protein
MAADLVILSREELRELVRQEVAAAVRAVLAEVRDQGASASTPESAKWAANSDELARHLGMCRTRVFDLLRTYPQLKALKRGHRFPIDEVKRALDALREAR